MDKMIQRFKRFMAIRSYMHPLSKELLRRFGKLSWYSIEQVTLAVKRSGLSAASIAYAHAAYCQQEDFDAHYKPPGIASNYLKLRQTIARRYFSGQVGFDAVTIINRFYRGNYGRSDGYQSGSDSDAFYGGDGGR